MSRLSWTTISFSLYLLHQLQSNFPISNYAGNYDTYVKTSDENIKNSMRVYQAYQDKRAHMMEFIDKFRASAARAKLVQSRIKAVEKMDLEAPELVVVEQLWRFSIPNPEPLGRPIISIDDVWFDYATLDEVTGKKKPKEEYILQKVNFGIDLDSRIGVLGANGAGKYKFWTAKSPTNPSVASLISICSWNREKYFAQLDYGSIDSNYGIHFKEQSSPHRAFYATQCR